MEGLIVFMSMVESDEFIIEKAVNLSIVEVFFGTIIHAFQIPFGGHFLSLNQGLFLCQFSKNSSNRYRAAKTVMEVSLIVALMKSLAPSSKKIGPIISISVQGFLFSLGTIAFGRNVFGQIISMVLLSLWAFIQPLITYFFIFGTSVFGAYDFYRDKLNLSEDMFFYSLIGLVLIKTLVSLSLPIISKDYPGEFFKKYEVLFDKLIKVRKNPVNPIKGAFKDLLSPIYLISLGMMLMFFFYQNSRSEFIWLLLRTLSLSFLLFYFFRSPFMSRGIYSLSLKSKKIKRLYQLAKQVDQKIQNSL